MREQIEKLLNSEISTSAIAKGARVPWSTVADLRMGKTSMDKMTLLTAEKLNDFAETKIFIFTNKKGEKMMERRIEELLNGIYELEFQGTMTFEEFADGYDFWVDEDDILLLEDRGIKPINGVRKVGYVDNGVIYAY